MNTQSLTVYFTRTGPELFSENSFWNRPLPIMYIGIYYYILGGAENTLIDGKQSRIL